jgi:8-oxo-dGTP pyrophosphatase MutT (NUDIX family)
MSISIKTATAAVAIIRSLVPSESFLVLRRVVHPDDPWSGHFSFPGGRKDIQDQDLLATCIRETREETGFLLHANQLEQRLPIEPAGQKSQHHLLVEPFLFTIDNQPNLNLCPEEIQSACWLNAEQFRNTALHKSVEMLPGRLFPAYPLEDYYLWGFTYRLLLTILQMDKRPK